MSTAGLSGCLFLVGGVDLAAQDPQLSGLIVFILPEPCLSSAFNFLNFMEGGGNVLSWQITKSLKAFLSKMPNALTLCII